MRIQLAYPFEGHKANEVISTDDRTARRLLREGRARPAPPPARPVATPAPEPAKPPTTAAVPGGFSIPRAYQPRKKIEELPPADAGRESEDD